MFIYDDYFDMLERQMDGDKLSFLDKCELYRLQEKDDINLEYEVGNFIRPLKFFVDNRHSLNFLQEGLIFQTIQELNIHKSFWAFSASPSRNGSRELYYRKHN